MKVAICIACHGSTKTDFTFCLARMIAKTLTAGDGIEVETLIARSALLVESRTRLFEWSRDWGATHILWLDADQTFPPDALLRLASLKLTIVGCNYRRRHPAVIPSAVKTSEQGKPELVATTPAKAAAGLIEEVDQIGFGCVLMEVAPIVEALGDDLYPLFEIRSQPDGNFVGEDVIFCQKLRAAGLKLHVDHALSLWIGHIAEQTLTFPHK